MRATCATNLPCLVARGLGHLPELLEEGESPSLPEVLVYDSFGDVTTETGLPARFAFRSLELEDSVPTFAAQTRCYNPAAGRWDERDPVGFAAGDANLHRYVHTEARGILLNEDGTPRDA